MALGLNWLDLLIIVVLIFFAMEALGRSLILETLDFISFVLAFFLSFRFYNLPSKLFENQFEVPHGLSLILGFMAVWFLTEVIFYILVRTLSPRLPKLERWINVFSAVPALFRGLIFIALTLVVIATFPTQPAIKKAVLDSKMGNFILNNAYALEGSVKDVFGGATYETLAFLTIKPQTTESIDLGFTTYEISLDEPEESAMIELLNGERTRTGLGELIFDKKLTAIAREHGKDMFRRGYFSHHSPEGETVADRAVKGGADFFVIGENLAYAPTLTLAHKGLMNSSGHRANILSWDYGKVGIGVMDGGVYGKIFVQVFSD